MTHIAYSGASQSLNAVLGGHVDIIITGAQLVKPAFDSGGVRVLANADKNRHPLFQDVPTLDEVGISDVYVGSHVGLLGPAGTPPAALKERFPDLVPEVPRAFERSVQGQLPLLRIGWALIRPQSEDGRRTTGGPITNDNR